MNLNQNIDYLWNLVSGHYQPKIWIPDTICLKEALVLLVEGGTETKDIYVGPSGVRALPLAAVRNEGGHYFHYKNYKLPVLFFSCSYHRYSKPQKGLS